MTAKDPITKAPEVWFRFCRGFHQDFGFLGLSFEEELQSMLSGMAPEDRKALKRYLTDIIHSDLTDSQLGKLFAKGGSDIIIGSRQKQPVRSFFQYILDVAN
ncbi:hypothetical protein [Kordiimonas marina]|uniref:hypothetical protein n=1 Tax=Kordiimonas marina TaxID=2872312 RepID=UPI001FF18814|nr:hypothetical protein [Kordiimonas marina]MCJ9430189.1 hypothetical protein [Kordiimonas marina]